MNFYLALLFSLIGYVSLNAQTSKVAILDFENTSGKTEYDALGKAISSMLITDLANNIHPKKVEFFERSQLNKLLDEQKLQKSKNFDAKTAVDFGKLSGVNYVFVGSVFVLDGACNFSSKLVDVQTSKILLAKDVSGKIEAWLQLKSQLAEAIANQLNNPITIDPSYKDQSTSLATINQYGKILTTMDGGDAEKAEQMRSLFEETNPDFKYYTDIKEDIEELKKQVEKNTADIQLLNQSGGRVINAKTPREIVMNIANPLTTYNDASQMITQLLTFDIDSVKEGNFNRFEFIWLPSKLPTDDLKIHLNDIAFLETCLVNKNVNPKTTSYYVFQHLRKYVNMFKQDKSKYAFHIEKLRTLANHLKEFNLEHKIFYIYDYNYFEMSTFLGSNSKPQILNPLDSEKFARDLMEFDFTIEWVMSFLN
jgi:TolB-like protein